VKSYRNLIDEISLVLRPGGMLELMEIDFSLYDLDHKRIPVDTLRLEGPWFARWFAFFKMAARGRGSDVDAATNMHQWLCDHEAFEDVVYKEFWVPNSPYHKGTDDASNWWRSVGEVARQDAYVRGFTLPEILFDVMSVLFL